VAINVIATAMKKVRRGQMFRFIGSPFDHRLASGCSSVNLESNR